MRTTLTIRTDEKLREVLRKRAALQGKTVSELAREILSDRGASAFRWCWISLNP